MAKLLTHEEQCVVWRDRAKAFLAKAEHAEDEASKAVCRRFAREYQKMADAGGRN